MIITEKWLRERKISYDHYLWFANKFGATGVESKYLMKLCMEEGRATWLNWFIGQMEMEPKDISEYCFSFVGQLTAKIGGLRHTDFISKLIDLTRDFLDNQENKDLQERLLFSSSALNDYLTTLYLPLTDKKRRKLSTGEIVRREFKDPKGPAEAAEIISIMANRFSYKTMEKKEVFEITERAMAHIVTGYTLRGLLQFGIDAVNKYEESHTAPASGECPPSLLDNKP